MKTKWIVALLMVLIAATLAGLWASRQPAKESAILPPPPRTAETVVRTVPARAPLETPIAPVEPPQPVAISPAPKPQKTVSSQPQATKQPKEPLHDPDARDALALVGIDS